MKNNEELTANLEKKHPVLKQRKAARAELKKTLKELGQQIEADPEFKRFTKEKEAVSQKMRQAFNQKAPQEQLLKLAAEKKAIKKKMRKYLKGKYPKLKKAQDKVEQLPEWPVNLESIFAFTITLALPTANIILKFMNAY